MKNKVAPYQIITVIICHIFGDSYQKTGVRYFRVKHFFYSYDKHFFLLLMLVNIFQKNELPVCLFIGIF